MRKNALAALVALAAMLAAASVQAAVGCPNDKPLDSVDVVSGNVTPPILLDPDQEQKSGDAYLSETWTKLSLATPPLSLNCRYTDGSHLSYSLPAVDTCTFYSQPSKAMVCQ